MSGPIVRTGTTPKFWQNWDNIFGGKQAGKKSTAKAAGKKKTAAKATTQKAKARKK